jgi:hypothetical protein
MSADEEIFFDDFYNNSTMSIDFEDSINKFDNSNKFDNNNKSKNNNKFDNNKSGSENDSLTEIQILEFKRTDCQRDFEREDSRIDSYDEVEGSGSVQVLQSASAVKRSKKKSFIYTNQSIALNVATGTKG